MKWEIRVATDFINNTPTNWLSQCLEEGFEPFAVTADAPNGRYNYHLKRRVEDEHD